MASRQGAGGNEVGVVGEGEETAARHRDIFGKTAMPMFAHDFHALAKRLIACEAIAAFAAERLGKEDRLRALLQTAAGCGLDNLTSSLHAHHLRQDAQRRSNPNARPDYCKHIHHHGSRSGPVEGLPRRVASGGGPVTQHAKWREGSVFTMIGGRISRCCSLDLAKSAP
jgi:hypothetical protein